MHEFVCGLCEAFPCRCGGEKKTLTRALPGRGRALIVSLGPAVVTVADGQLSVTVPDEWVVDFDRPRI